MWLDRDDLRQIRALASLEGKHPRFAEALRYARKCRGYELVDNVNTETLVADHDDRRARMVPVLRAMRWSAGPRGGRRHTSLQADALEFVLEGHSLSDVADRFGITKPAASQLLSRAQQTARAVLNGLRWLDG